MNARELGHRIKHAVEDTGRLNPLPERITVTDCGGPVDDSFYELVLVTGDDRRWLVTLTEDVE